MNPSETLEAITSNDNHQAWLAAWDIIRANEAELEQYFLPHLKVIKLAIDKLKKSDKSVLRDSRDCVRLALRILDAVNDGKCRCSVFTSTNQMLPESEEKYGLIEIIEKRDIPWEPEYKCKCTQCGQMFLAIENHGYHYPWSKWIKENV